MQRSRFSAVALVALTALLFGYLLANQLRLQLIPSGDRVQRNAALVQSVQHLEATNAVDRSRVQKLRADVDGLEAAAARRSDAAQQVEAELNDLRAHAGLVALHGPGVSVTVTNGTAVPSAGVAGTSTLVTFEDVQDVVNLLFQAGAEGVAVNGQRITPISAFKGSGAEVVIDQGPPLSAPFRVVAVGDRNAMQNALQDPSLLGDLRRRQDLNQVRLDWNGDPALTLPPYDGALEVTYAHAP